VGALKKIDNDVTYGVNVPALRWRLLRREPGPEAVPRRDEACDVLPRPPAAAPPAIPPAAAAAVAAAPGFAPAATTALPTA
jgi:hypothetical protein